MAKKKFIDNTANIDRLFSEFEDTNRPEEQPVQETAAQEAPKAEEKTFYRINLKLDGRHKEFLDVMSWRQQKSITQFLNDMIEACKTEQAQAFEEAKKIRDGIL